MEAGLPLDLVMHIDWWKNMDTVYNHYLRSRRNNFNVTDVLLDVTASSGSGAYVSCRHYSATWQAPHLLPPRLCAMICYLNPSRCCALFGLAVCILLWKLTTAPHNRADERKLPLIAQDCDVDGGVLRDWGIQPQGALATFDRARLEHRVTTSTGMHPAEAAAIVTAYLRFFQVNGYGAPHGEDYPAPPIIDNVWKLHSLDTEAYLADCESMLGYFLHHPVCSQRWTAEQVQQKFTMLRSHFFTWYGTTDYIPSTNSLTVEPGC